MRAHGADQRYELHRVTESVPCRLGHTERRRRGLTAILSAVVFWIGMFLGIMYTMRPNNNAQGHSAVPSRFDVLVSKSILPDLPDVQVFG